MAAAVIARFEEDQSRSADAALEPGSQSPWLQQGRSRRLGG
jgi:hypothetical protein